MKNTEGLVSDNLILDDYTALELGRLLLKMKKDLLDTPQGRKDYAQWHLKEYGCLPEQSVLDLEENHADRP